MSPGLVLGYVVGVALCYLIDAVSERPCSHAWNWLVPLGALAVVLVVENV